VESPYSLTGLLEQPELPQPVPAQAMRQAMREAMQAAAPLATLPPLPSIPDADLLTPGSAEYDQYLPAFNLRTAVAPALRALCKSEAAVAAMVNWVRDQNVPFAVRCGGHSFEGFSQSPQVVIDVRGIDAVAVDLAGQTVTVGSGASLGAVYQALQTTSLAFAAGSCPTVGVAGHVLGGGMGLLGRAYGLTCDNLLSIALVDANGAHVDADAQTNPDLFWACRGGGGGSFGIATAFRFRLQSLAQVVTFGVSWTLAKTAARRLFAAWQQWAPAAPRAITSIMRVGGRTDGRITLRCIGQSTGSESDLSDELDTLLNVEDPNADPSIVTRSFFDAVDHFSGGWNYETIYHKGKSDYVVGGLSNDGINALLTQMVHAAPSQVIAICDAYGGAIADVAAADTAFPHRDASTYCIQYYSQWGGAGDTAHRLQLSRAVYAALRPFVSGACYVNYCDTDVAEFATAYWGDNLARLRQVKAQYDPANLFHHAQSVPLP
jgi:FAD/FMN-containing dehydrogenase